MERNETYQIKSNGCAMVSGAGYCPKPLETVSGFLSKKWTISIIITIGNFDKLRFNDIEQRIAGITPKTLSDRLKEALVPLIRWAEKKKY